MEELNTFRNYITEKDPNKLFLNNYYEELFF